MKPLELMIAGERGYLFEGEISDALVFVPHDCVFFTDSGDAAIDQTGCFLSGWTDKSMRFSSDADDGERVFASAERPVTNPNDPRVKALLQRLRHVYSVTLAS